MRFALFIALRYLVTRRKQTFISLISIISVLGVALGVASLIAAMGIMNGFTTDLRDKILAINSQIVVYKNFGGFTESDGIRELVKEVPGVKEVTPFIYTELMLSSRNGVKGIMLRGIETATAPQVVTSLQSLEHGSLNDLEPQLTESGTSGVPGIIIGSQLASRLGLTVGSRINILSPTGRHSSAGYAPLTKPFTVSGIFSTGMAEYDTTLTFASLDSARMLMGLKTDYISGLEIITDNIFAANSIAEKIQEKLGDMYRVLPWSETNYNLFAALQLEKLVMGIVLALIVLVGSFSIITTLIMLVMEKTRDIAIMMSMGATTKSIRRIFIFQGGIIGCIGTLLGFVLGLTICFLLKRYQFIELPPGVYPVDYVPILLQWKDLLIIGLGAVAICFLATLYPAHQASRLVPTEALRYE